MSLTGKLIPPFPSSSGPAQPALEHALEGGTTLFAAPEGFVPTSRLAGLLQKEQSPAIWLRVGPEDRDPATLLISLARGADTIFAGISEQTFPRMRTQPGPISGWAPLFSGLARDIADAAASMPATSMPAASQTTYNPNLTLIIQHIHQLYANPAALALLHDNFLPLLPSETSSILISHAPPPRGGLPGYIMPVTTHDLRMTEPDALSLVDDCFRANTQPTSLSINNLRRMINLLDGCATALSSVCGSYPWLGGQTFQQVIEASTGRVDLLARLMRCGLQLCPQPLDDLLALAYRLNYLHPDIALSALSLNTAAYAPLLNSGWFQPLESGGFWLNCIWHEPLQMTLHPSKTGQRKAARRIAEQLIRSGEVDQAIPLLIEQHYFNEAADALVDVAEPMMNHGQWETLSTWLSSLPEGTRRDRPWLVYMEGELAATKGQGRAARRYFANATRLFSNRSDPAGACNSLLAESILAARQNNVENAAELA